MTTITATLTSELVRLGSYKPVPFHGIGSLTRFYAPNPLYACAVFFKHCIMNFKQFLSSNSPNILLAAFFLT